MILIAVGVCLPIMWLVYNSHYSNYDLIKHNGLETRGVVVDIQIDQSEKYNNKNPYILYYSFDDKFGEVKSMSNYGLSIGDTVKVIATGNRSIIKGVEPVSFPYLLLMIVPIVFSIIGLVLRRVDGHGNYS